MGDFSFSQAFLGFCIVCEMALGAVKWFRRPLRVSRSVRNGFGCAKFFAWSAKISHSDRNDFTGVGLFSLGVLIWFVGCAKFHTLCEMIP